MASFRFRLQSIERIRQAEREEKQRALAEAHQAQQELERLQADLVRQVEEVRAQYRQQAQPGRTNVDHLMHAHRYELGLQATARDLAEKARLLADEAARRQAALVEADRQVRVMERLREIHHTRYLREAEKRENQLLDEAAANAVRKDQEPWAT